MHFVLAILVLVGACGGGHRSAPTRGGATEKRKASDVAPTASQLQAALTRADASALSLAGRMEAAGQPLSAAQIEALEAIVDALEVSDLETLTAEGRAGGLLHLRRALLAHHRGDTRAAQLQLEAAERSGLDAQRVQKVRERLAGISVDAAKVAVLLPLSGEHAQVGAELWAGMELASRGDSSAALELYDTKGSEEGARAAVKRAAAAGSLLAIGPAGRLESQAAALQAMALGLPIALLAPQSDASDGAGGVFRLSLSPAFEAEQAALVAVELGYELLAVMAPRDALGAAQTQAFVAAAKGVGAEVVRIGSYGPAIADLESDFKDLLNLHPANNARLRKHLRRYGRKSWKSFSPMLDFDLLYIPDGLERGALVASYLPFFNVELRNRDKMGIARLQRKHGRMPRIVQVMAPSTWVDPSLAARGGEAVEGALLIGTCPGGLGIDLSAQGRSFAADFQKSQGRAPSRAAAAGFDAMRIVLQSRKAAARRGGRRSDLERSLLGFELRDGLCGSLKVNSEGQLEGQIEVLRVEMGVPEIYEY